MQQLHLRVWSSPDGRSSRPPPSPLLCRCHACRPPVLTPLRRLSPTFPPAVIKGQWQIYTHSAAQPLTPLAPSLLPSLQPSGLLKVRSSDLEIPYWSMHACTHMCACVWEGEGLCLCVSMTLLCSSGLQEPGLGLGFGKRQMIVFHELFTHSTFFNRSSTLIDSSGRTGAVLKSGWMETLFLVYLEGKIFARIEVKSFREDQKFLLGAQQSSASTLWIFLTVYYYNYNQLYYRSIKPCSDCKTRTDF